MHHVKATINPNSLLFFLAHEKHEVLRNFYLTGFLSVISFIVYLVEKKRRKIGFSAEYLCSFQVQHKKKLYSNGT
jgi:hypothetical protein